MGMVSTPPGPGTPDTRPPMVRRRGCGRAGHGSQYYYNLPHRQQQAQTGNGNTGEAEPRGQ